MAEIYDFLKGNRVETDSRKEVKLPSFPKPFVIKNISETENTKLKRSAMVPTTKAGSRGPKELDTNKYQDILVVNCVVEPDLSNAELQADYGTDGSAIETLREMLLAGEYMTLSKEVIEFNGFSDDDFEDLTDEVKN